jgi:hypothetical protein
LQLAEQLSLQVHAERIQSKIDALQRRAPPRSVEIPKMHFDAVEPPSIP